VHIKHKWSPWHRLIDLSDAAKFELKDIDQRICAKCGKRQQREVKP
jgi:hypothetical protein